MKLLTAAKQFSAVLTLTAGALIFSGSACANPTENVIHVDEFGAGSPVVLIPGLMSDGSVWQSTVRALQQNHKVYVVNIAGFGRTPAAADTSLENVEQALTDYLVSHQIENPVVIGHSMGGFLAMALAVNPEIKISKAISVDGLPYIAAIFTRSNNVTVDMMRSQAAMIKTSYASMSRQQFTGQTRMGLALQSGSEAGQQKVMAFAEESDPATVGQMMHDLLQRDLREELSETSTSILLLGASGGFDTPQAHQTVEMMYEQQLANAPHGEVKMNTQSRHFMMYDDPAWLNEQINHFIKE